MFGTIRRHQRWLWIVIILIVIPSFVMYFTPTKQSSQPSSSDTLTGAFVGGRPITQGELASNKREVLLESISAGNLPDPDMLNQMDAALEQRAYLRILILEKAKEYGLYVSDEAKERLAGEVVSNFRRSGVNSYREFVDGVLSRYKLKDEDFERFVRRELLVRQVVQLEGLAGVLVTPQEAGERYQRENEEVDAQVVVFPVSNFLATVTVTPEALTQYYSNHVFEYRIGERAVLDYLHFAASNYFAEADQELNKVTNLTAQLDALYLRLGTNAPDAKTPEESKAKIKEQERDRIALQFARRAATEFATVIYGKNAHTLDTLRQTAAASNLVVRSTEPFIIEDGPKEFKVPASFARLVANLTTNEAVALSPVVTTNAIYLVGLKQHIPSETPPLDGVRERVTEEFKRSEALMAAQKAGVDAAKAIRLALAATNSFTEACAAAKVTAFKLPPFSLRTQSDPEIEKLVNLGLLHEAAFKTSSGGTSDFEPTPSGGFILHVAGRLPVNVEKMKPELPGYLRSMRQTRQNELLDSWIRRQLESRYIMVPERRAESPSTVPVGQ